MPALLAAIFLLLAPVAALAKAGPSDSNDHVETRIVAASNAVGDGGVVRLGLHFRMASGWKIYWRSPGDAGFPPQVDWAGSENLASASIDWPVPERFSVFGLETLGYEDEVLLPVTATLERPGEALHLAAFVRYLACKEICIPYEARLGLDLPAGAAGSSQEAGLIDGFAAKVPGPDTGRGLVLKSAILLNRGGEPVLQVALGSDAALTAPDAFVEAPDGAVFGKPVAAIDASGHRAVLELKGAGAKAAALDGRSFTVTVVDGDRFLERQLDFRLGDPLAPPIPAAVEAPEVALWHILLLAVLGGLILNLMPCVLPVLSIKLLAAVGHGGGSPAAVRAGFLATAGGIVVSMLAIAAALSGLKAAGLAVGWGIQFQQPVFLAFMLVVITLFACNLFGLFEILLPQRLSSMALAAGGGSSLGGNFLTGAFATLLATPCSAPFVGTAIGFALSRGMADIFAVFAALGIGLALPYLAVVAFPRVATTLPRPGPWMVTLRRVLALALVATGGWLLSVIAAQIGTEGAVLLGAMMLLIGAVLALRRLPGSRLGRYAGVAVAILAVAALALPVFREPAPPAVHQRAAGQWQVFDPVALRRIVDGGGTVFVDVTADWCLTCQVNKKLVVDQGDVADWLARDDVVAMRADWTRPDPAIAAYLAGFGRYGIPFNAVYGPRAPDGIALPELLTTEIVLDAAAKAGSATR
jgi:suppressor for copper-sensitivity B